jgi:hypothetical protein
MTIEGYLFMSRERAEFAAFYLLLPGEDRLIVAPPVVGDPPRAESSSGAA